MVKGMLILLFCLFFMEGMCQDSCQKRPYRPINILSNPSFEDNAVPCSSGFQNIPFWFTPTNEVLTGFLNACDSFKIPDTTIISYSFSQPNICLFPVVPLPIPDGNGVAAVSDFGYGGDIRVYPLHKSYVSTCLSSPLQKDSFYRLVFYVGFGGRGSEFLQAHNGLLAPEFSQSPETFSLFGLPDCSGIATSLPLIGCASRAGWINLGSVTVSADTGTWAKAVIDFTTSQNIGSIALGPSCDTTLILHPDTLTYEDSSVSTIDYSYFLDNLQFYQSSYPDPVISRLSGNSCSTNIVLQMQPASFFEGSLLQWQKNDTALSGEQTPTISISRKQNSAGIYTCKVMNDSACIISDTIQVVWSPIPDASLLGGPDTTVCKGDTLVLNPSADTSFNYRWQNGSVQPALAVTRSGIYSVTISNQCGTAQTQKMVQFGLCDNMIDVPSAFTPNGDGHNDLFKVVYHILPNHFTLRIYDREGMEVFYCADPSQGWDWAYNGIKQPAGAYVWVIQYTDLKKTPHTIKGTLVLVR